MTKATVVLAKGEGFISDETLRKLAAKSNTTGYLAEMGFPKVPVGVHGAEFAEYYSRINPQRVCAKITNIRRGDDGESVIADVEAYGAMGKSLKKRIEGDRADTLLFGVRALINHNKKDIVTFDLIKF